MLKKVHVALQDANATDTDVGGSLYGNASNLSITGATKAANCQITCTGHGRIAGDWVWITSVNGMTQLNNLHHKVASVIDANNITLTTDSTGYSTFTSAGWLYGYAATKTNPCYIRKQAHKYAVGQEVYLSGLAGMVELNGVTATVTSVEGLDTFGININATSYTTWSSAGTVKAFHKLIQGITKANPAVVTCNDHPFVNGSRVILQNVGGMVEVNDKVYTVANAATNTFELSGVNSTAFTTCTTSTATNASNSRCTTATSCAHSPAASPVCRWSPTR